MEEFIKKAKNGDITAYTELIKKIEKDLYRIAYIKIKNNDDINDAIQNTMIIMFKNIKKLKEDKYFKTWIIKILINECNKIIKENSRRNKIMEKIVDNMNLKSISNNEEFMNFNNMIEKLSSDEQLIFSLYYKDKFSCEEISQIVKIKKGTVQSKLDRGRDKIKRYLEGRDFNAII